MYVYVGVIGLGKDPRTHRVMFSVEKLGYPWDTLEIQSLGLEFKSWAFQLLCDFG